MAETKWTSEQWEAIRARDCNLLVAAAAGAGKTAVLVERIIQKITAEENPVDIDRLLVVTFTNAAAAEMRERIAEAIASVLEKNPENKNIQRQLTLLSKASITTIHSFCLEVIRGNFQNIDIDPGFRISDETEAALMKLEVLQELFEELYEDEEHNQDFFELLECYGGNRDDQALQDMVLQLYTFIQSSPWPDKWLEEMTGKFSLSSSLESPEQNNLSLDSSEQDSLSLDSLAQGKKDFSQTSWGEILLGSARMELESLGQKLAMALEIIRGPYGLEKYFPVFQEEYDEISRLQTLCDSQGTSRWDDLYKAIKEFSFQRLPAAGKDADKEQQEVVKELRDEVKKSLTKLKDRFFSGDSEEIFGDLQGLYPHLKCLQRLAGEFGRRYALKKSEKSLVDFNDLEHFCLEILTEQGEDGVRRPSPVALGLKDRFAEILVDEYQDSNLVQEMIIGMIRKEPEIPNVFMVGDVKQSIYRFRQAKPELFLEKYRSYSTEEGAASRKILLYKNFRSRKEVVDGVNFLFRQIMSVTAGELDYTEEEALYPGAVYAEPDQDSFLVGGEVELHLLETKDQKTAGHRALDSEHSLGGDCSSNDARDRANVFQDETDGNRERGDENRENGEGNQENGDGIQENGDAEDDGPLDPEMLDSIQSEARLVARRIQELIYPDQESGAYAVYDRGRKAYRRVEYRDIVILLRTTKNWAEVFSEELALEGIPAFADTGTGFFKTSEVQVILSLLQVIDNPLQDIPLLAVLRSPLFAFTTDELAVLRLAQKRGPLYQALKSLAHSQESGVQESTARDKARNFLASLEKWREQSLYLPTDQLLWQIYSETGYYGIVGAMPAGEQRQANLRILFERARQYEETSFKGLFNFISFIDKLKSSKGDMGSAKILGENDNVVRIMSIHKSKGLEFPVVILSGCGKKFNLQDMNKSILLHQDLGFGPDIVDYRLRLAYPSLAKQAIREKIKAETLSEEMRILYVAMTRAREKLIITGAVRDLSKALAKWSACAESQEDKIPPGMILKGEKYLDWIVPALLRHSDSGCGKNFKNTKAYIGTAGASAGAAEASVWRTKLWSKEDLVSRPAGQSQAAEELESCLREMEAGEKALSGEFQEEIFRRLNWEYPYIQMSRVPAKISVTELKRLYEEEPLEDAFENTFEDTPKEYASDQQAFIGRGTSGGLLKMKKPLFLEGKKGLSAAEKGTVMHFVMQHLDLGRQDFAEQLKEMTLKDLLTPEQAGSVDTAKIESFVNSSLGQRMLSAGYVAREVPFNLEIPCREVYRELKDEYCQGETVLLQGVIDCFFEEPDGLVLVDYKTDRVKEDWEETIRSRYKVQLSYYAKALEMLTGKKVKEQYIYLFQNGEILRL